MNKKILFIIDELELKYFEFNRLVTNFWLIKCLLDRGFNVAITVKNLLYLEGASPMAKIYNTVSKNNNILKEDTPNTACLNEFGTIFMRPDPPVDIDYINATYILDYVNKETLILNSPKALRDFNEKLYINKFPNLAPKNIVSANKNIIKEFLFNEEEIIIKPLNRCFSSGVFYLNKNDKNINAIIDTATNNGKTQVMVQKFLKGILKGDKRLIFIGGEIFNYAVRKVATNNDFKFNEHIKENLIRGDLSKEEQLIEKEIAQTLLNDGVYIAGLDVIDGKIIEINITSPCFFINEINSIYNINFENIITDKILEVMENSKKEPLVSLLS